MEIFNLISDLQNLFDQSGPIPEKLDIVPFSDKMVCDILKSGVFQYANAELFVQDR